MSKVTHAFVYLSLLGLISHSLCVLNSRIDRRQADPSLDVPTDAKKLPQACQDSLFAAGVSAEFKNSKAFTGEYFVQLKLSATAKDITDVLAQPPLTGVKMIQTYTKEYDRGFSAKLSYEQVCALDKDARVSHSRLTAKTKRLTISSSRSA
jgi:hypothetical protein